MQPRYNLIGRKFGTLTVTNRGEDRTVNGKTHSTWICRCECGGEITVTTTALCNYDIVHCGNCGSMRGGPRDLVGWHFGKLEVLRPYSRTLHNSPTWICRCDCGREVAYSTKELKYGHITDCGVCSGREYP